MPVVDRRRITRYHSLGGSVKMQREVIADLKSVYYRGRFRASTAWSRIGKSSGGEKSPVAESATSKRSGSTKQHTKTGVGYRPVV